MNIKYNFWIPDNFDLWEQGMIKPIQSLLAAGELSLLSIFFMNYNAQRHSTKKEYIVLEEQVKYTNRAVLSLSRVSFLNLLIIFLILLWFELYHRT